MSDKRKTKSVVWAVVAILAVLVLVVNSVAFGSSEKPTAGHSFLPLLLRNYPAPPNVYGAEVIRITTGSGVDTMSQAGASWLRYNGIVWYEVEPQKGNYDWSTIDTLKTQLAAVQDKDLNIILVIRGTPTWAREVPTSPCGPIKTSELSTFAQFVRQVVGMLSVAPYNVKYWEIGNEPDAPIADVDYNFGCWGRPGTPHFGGEQFGEMLKVVYPAVKAADPNSKVILGGLLLDCDPNNPPAGKDCSSSRFLEGVLADGAGPYFDAVGYHAYDYYQGNGSYINGNWHADLSTGPSSAIRDQFVKSVLQPYGYQNKPLFNTETSLVCMDNPNDPNYCTNGYENTKAAYVALDYAMAMANSVSVRIWYNVIGEWRHSGLLNSISSPRPAYDAFKTGATELGYATFVKDLTQPQLPSGVRGYQFTRDNRTVWFLWSTSVSSHQVTFNRAPANAFDTVGHALTPAQTMSVDNNPRYFEWIGNP